MARALPGDDTYLEAMFQAHAAALLRLAVVLTGDRTLAEDLVQEAVVRLHRSGVRPALWNPAGKLVTFDGDPVADNRGLSQDRSFEWLLFVDEAGVVNAGRFDTGDIPPIPDLPEAIAADW